MKEKAEAVNWHDLSSEEQAKLVEQAAMSIAQDTGYKSREEKATARKSNGTLANIDPRKDKQKGNRPNPKTRKHRGGLQASVAKLKRK